MEQKALTNPYAKPFLPQQGRVSVVVPVYNTAPYLDRCIRSLQQQTWQDLEVLLIDDGSTDSSADLCDRWASEDSRIRVIHKENAGLGMARNTGLACATGEAVCFLDSDDYLLPQAVETAYTHLLRNRAEVSVFGMVWEVGGSRPIHPEQQTYRGREVAEAFLPAMLQQRGNLPISSCTALYSMDLIRRIGWQFPSERQIIAEDVYALLDLYGEADAVTVVPDALYIYCHNETSLTRRYRPDRFDRVKGFYDACLELCRRKHYPESVRQSCAAPFLGFTVGCMKQEIRRRDWRAIGRMVRDPLVRKALKEDPEKPGLKKKLLFFAMNRGTALTCLVLLLWEWTQREGRHET